MHRTSSAVLTAALILALSPAASAVTRDPNGGGTACSKGLVQVMKTDKQGHRYVAGCQKPKAAPRRAQHAKASH